MQRLQAHAVTLRRFGIIFCGIFDVALLVSLDLAQHCFDTFINLSFYLEDLLGHSVDLVTSERLSKHLAASVLLHRYCRSFRMSPSPREILLHILDETTYWIERVRHLSDRAFLADPMLKRALARSWK